MQTDDEQFEEPIDYEEPEQTPNAEEKADGTGEPKDEPVLDAKQLQADLKREREGRQEAERNAQFWHERAKTTTPPERKEAAKPVEDVKLSEDLVDAVSSGDAKRVKKLMGEIGLVDKTEVAQLVNERAEQIIAEQNAKTIEQQLYADNPDLKNQDSPLFRAAARHYQDLKQDPAMARSPRLMQTAVKLAKAELDTSDADRARRVGRQAGDRERVPARGESAETQELSRLQKDVVAKFRAVGANIDEAKYKARALKGVQRGGTPTRRS
jgi:hypothetical protein